MDSLAGWPEVSLGPCLNHYRHQQGAQVPKGEEGGETGLFWVEVSIIPDFTGKGWFHHPGCLDSGARGGTSHHKSPQDHLNLENGYINGDQKVKD